MAKKLESIVQLAAQTAQQISANSGNYMAFLTTAAHNFKYNFRDQLLIYAQKPDATACAQIDFWNKYGRWVNRGTTGIALLVDTDRGYKLRHVFDMSDTNSRAGRTIPIWQMKPQYEGAVVEALENSYGEFSDKSDFAECLMQTAKVIVEDNFSDYCAELRGVKEGSLLEELDDLSTESWFKGLLENSVAYVMLTRCGVDPQEFFNGEDFAHIYDFNTPETLSILGGAVSDIAEMPLREIASTVLNLYREEQKQNRTFAGPPASRYNHGRTQPQNKAQFERSVEHGTDVPNGERLPPAQPGRAGGPEGRKIWDAAAQLSQKPQERLLHGDASQRQVERPSGENRPAGHRDGGTADGANGAGTGRDGGTESVRRDEVGGPDEQHPGSGGGSGVGGADLHRRVSDPLPTEEEQRAAIQEAEDEQSSAFAISQEDIDAVLIGHNTVGKLSIYGQFLKQESAQENADFLKGEYGIVGYTVHANRKLDIWADGKGIKITAEPDTVTVLTWKKAVKRIGELLAADRYLSPAEKEQYPAYREQRAVIAARREISKEFHAIFSDYKDYIQQLGKQNKTVDRWYLASCADAFSAGHKKMYARASEGDFILPMMREAMRTIIGEGTHLTERCEAMLAELSGPLAAPLEPDYDELNPVPAPPKEYRLTLGATVYLGTQRYELLALDDQAVRLFDPAFPIINKELPRTEFDRLLAENPLNDGLLQEVEDAAPAAEPAEPDTPGYDLGYGHMGNGVTVWNRLELRDGDYKTIAHISPDRTVTYYEDGLPESVRARIEEIAATSTMSISATQDASVFSTSPLVREPAALSTEASEPAYLPHELPYIFCEWSESIVFQDKTAYSLQEFDRLMKQADDEYVAGRAAAMAKYGTWQKWYDANDPEYRAFLGYDKVKFTLVMPNGQIFTERQDIGDGDGGVLDFLEQYDKYRKIVPALREAIRKEAEGPLNISAPQPEPVSGRFWDAYNSIKERYHDSLVLYQVGDFFELYGEDAKTAALELDLTLTLRNIPEYGRLPMCGFPAHALEDNAARLTAQGYDVTVAALEETQRKISPMPAPPVEKAKRIIRHFYTDDFEKPVDFSDLHNVTFSHRTTRDGKHHIVMTADLIDYRLICQADGEVMLSLQCHDMDDLTEYLTNLSVDNLIDYVEAQYEKRQPQPKDDDFSDIDPAAIRAALAENGIVDGHVVDPEKLDANPFIQQVMADVEQIAADALTPDERFSIIETEKGYAVWDDIQGGIYVDGEGVQEEFSSEWQAEDYLKQVRKDAADKEAADWLAVERAKQEPKPQEPAPPASQDRDTEKVAEYLFDQEHIVISKFPNGKFYKHRLTMVNTPLNRALG